MKRILDICNNNHNAPERDIIFNGLFIPHLEIKSNIRLYFTVMNYHVFWTIKCLQEKFELSKEVNQRTDNTVA
jgi:hypothetical protein